MFSINPDFLTYLRILLTLFIVLFIVLDNKTAALILFVLATLTDLGDGYISRLFKKETRWGRLIDPIADKILIISVLISVFIFGFENAHQQIIIIFKILLAALIIREVCITVIRIIEYQKSCYQSFKTPAVDSLLEPNKLGKIKMALLVISISLFLMEIFSLGIIIFLMAVICAFFSIAEYATTKKGRAIKNNYYRKW